MAHLPGNLLSEIASPGESTGPVSARDIYWKRSSNRLIVKQPHGFNAEKGISFFVDMRPTVDLAQRDQ